MVVRYWKRLPRKVVESVLLEVFKNYLMWCLGIYFTGRLGSGRLMAGLNVLRECSFPALMVLYVCILEDIHKF